MDGFGTWASDVELAQRLADEAAQIALGYFGRDVERVEKDDGTPVSAADLAVEAALVETIGRERPGDAVLPLWWWVVQRRGVSGRLLVGRCAWRG